MQNADAKLKDNVKQYIQMIAEYPKLSQEEEMNLYHRIQQGDKDAKDLFIRCNLKLVVSVAKQYIRFSVPFMDLIQEGNLGLMKAIEKFDPNMGYRFSTYAIQWIRQSISRYIMDKGKVIHIPVHVIENEFKVRKAADALLKEYHREPTAKELAIETGFSEEKVLELLNLIQDPLSIDMNVNDENETYLSELIPDPNANHIRNHIDKVFIHNDIIKSLAVLNERERDIIIKHFGLNQEPALTLEEIGKIYGITRERVRQIERAAIRKLKAADVRKFLEAYYHDLK